MIRVITLVFLFLVRRRFPVQLLIISVLRKRYGDTVVKQVRKFGKLHFECKKHRWIFNFYKCARVKMLFRIF